MPPLYLLKQSPADFIVEEEGPAGLKESGAYAIVSVRKEGLDTEAVRRILAQAFHREVKDIGYAGLKDKQAITTQAFSIQGIGAAAIERFEHPRLKLSLRGFSDTPIFVGSHRANRFTINAELIGPEGRAAYERGATRIRERPVLVNYFDEQRFSTKNVDIGLAMLKKDFSRACALLEEQGGRDGDAVRSWLATRPTDKVGALGNLSKDTLLLFIHAVQSRVWNAALSAYAREHARGPVQEITYSQGTLAMPDDPSSLEGVEIPLVGFGMDHDPRFERSCSVEMQALGISERDFIFRQLPISSEGGRRSALVPITDFHANDAGEGVVTLSFTLPKGSYATMVLKELFLS